MTDDTTFEPLVFFEYDDDPPGRYCLMMSDTDIGVVEDVIEERGYDANGYGWEGVARSAIQAHAPEIADRIEFDSESGTFVADSLDADALRRLGTLLHKAFHDQAELKRLIDAADPDWFD